MVGVEANTSSVGRKCRSNAHPYYSTRRSRMLNCRCKCKQFKKQVFSDVKWRISCIKKWCDTMLNRLFLKGFSRWGFGVWELFPGKIWILSEVKSKITSILNSSEEQCSAEPRLEWKTPLFTSPHTSLSHGRLCISWYSLSQNLLLVLPYWVCIYQQNSSKQTT